MYRARHFLATNIADFFNFALLLKTVPRTKCHFRYHNNIKGWRTKKAPRDIDDVSWAVGKSFSYVFLFTNQTKLFKRQGGGTKTRINDRKTSTAQPTTMTIETRQRGARDLFRAIGMFLFQFFLTIFNIFRYHDSIRRWRTTTTMNKRLPIPAPRHGHTTISHFHRHINTCLPPTFNTTTFTWGQIELEMHCVSSHRYAFYIFTKYI